jgi:hypothetical protein
MRGLVMKNKGFRHGRACPGHPRRNAHFRFKAYGAVGRRETVGVLKPPRRLTAWMPGTSPGMTRRVFVD